jgi:hypothetical protein
MNHAGLEALAGKGGTSPAKASSPVFSFSLSTIHYPLSTTLTPHLYLHHSNDRPSCAILVTVSYASS